MLLTGTVLCIVATFFVMVRANERFLPQYPEFWISIILLVIGYVLLYKYCQQKDII